MDSPYQDEWRSPLPHDFGEICLRAGACHAKFTTPSLSQPDVLLPANLARAMPRKAKNRRANWAVSTVKAMQ
jgi:hypothetical protein